MLMTGAIGLASAAISTSGARCSSFWQSWNIPYQTGVIGGPRTNKRDKVMKMLVSGFALALALAFTGPAFAQDAPAATDKASCDKAGGTWDDAAKKCNPKQ